MTTMKEPKTKAKMKKQLKRVKNFTIINKEDTFVLITHMIEEVISD